MNEQSRELCHWGVKPGAERAGHKYLVRVEGKRPGSYRYFYDMTEYNNWKNGAKSKIKEFGSMWKSGAKSIKENLPKGYKKTGSWENADVTKKGRTSPYKHGRQRSIEMGIEFLKKRFPFLKVKEVEYFR